MPIRLGFTGIIVGLLSMIHLEPTAAVAQSKETAETRQVVIEQVRVGLTPGRARLVFDLSAEVDYELFKLESPDRVVVDLQNAMFGSPVKEGLFRSTPVEQMHTLSRDGRDLRLVFDLQHARLRIQDFVLKPYAGKGHRLVLDFYPSRADKDQVVEKTVVDAVDAVIAADLPSAESVVPDRVQQSERPPSMEMPVAAKEPKEENDEGVANTGQPEEPEVPAVESGSSEDAKTNVELQRNIRDIAFGVEFSGTWEQEWAYAIEAGHSQKFENLIEPRLDLSFGSGFDLTIIGRVRLDGVGDLGPYEGWPDNYSQGSGPFPNGENFGVSLREMYLDFRVRESEWRVGKQQVVWGQADGIKVLDVVNPQSFREFILDDFDKSRIPLWMVNVSIPAGSDGTLQLLWIPDNTYHELAEYGTPFAITSPRLVPQVPPPPISLIADVDRPDNPLEDGDYGFQYSSYAKGWDLTLNYLYHYVDTPLMPVRLLPHGQFLIEPEYQRSHLLGGTLSTAIGPVTLRGELAYNSNTFHPHPGPVDGGVAESAEISSVVGVDWVPNIDTLLSLQWFSSYLLDHERLIYRHQSENLMTLVYQQDFSNATWRFRAMGIHSLEDGDSMLQLKLRYWLLGNLEVWLGADFFAGTSSGLFGQFQEQDRVLLGFRYGF